MHNGTEYILRGKSLLVFKLHINKKQNRYLVKGRGRESYILIDKSTSVIVPPQIIPVRTLKFHLSLKLVSG